LVDLRKLSAVSRAQWSQTMHFFLQLIAGAGLTIFQQLARLSSGLGCYCWDPLTKSKYSWRGQVEWPVAWLLASHHKKHIFCRGMVPSSKIISACLSQWERKVWWRVGLTDPDEPIDRRSEHEIGPFKSKKKSPKCDRVDDRVRALTLEVKRNVYQCLSSGRHFQGNTIPLVTLALRLVRRSSMAYTLTDKDGGFAASEVSELAVERSRILNSVQYRKVLRSSHINEDAGKELETLLLEVTTAEYGDGFKMEKNRLYSDLTSDFRKGAKNLNGIVASLGLTCKTHKGQGEVVGRALHCSHCSPLKPVLRWLAFCLRQEIRGFPHLLKDSHELTKKLKSVRFPRG
jgi:hypothetical protein